MLVDPLDIKFETLLDPSLVGNWWEGTKEQLDEFGNPLIVLN